MANEENTNNLKIYTFTQTLIHHPRGGAPPPPPHQVTHSCIVQSHQTHHYSIPEFLTSDSYPCNRILRNSCTFLHRLMHSCSTKPCYRNKNAIPAYSCNSCLFLQFLPIPAIPAYSCNSCNSCLFVPIPAIPADSCTSCTSCTA